MNWNYLSKYRSEIMGAACLWVMAFHNLCRWPRVFRPLEMLCSHGNVGVDVFLLLSGIGLYYSYSKYSAEESTIHKLKDFYWKRIVRLLVPYVMLGAPYYAWYSRDVGIGSFILNFSQINLFRHGLTTSWYVPATFIFYLMFPLIYYFQQKEFSIGEHKIERNTVTLIMCLVMFASNAAMLILIPEIYAHFEIAASRVIVFIIGCGIGKEVREKKVLSETAALGSIACILIYIYAFYPNVEMPTLCYRMTLIVLGLSAAIAFAYCFSKLDEHKKIRAFFTFFGERSLELYLSHVFIKRIWLAYMEKQIFDRWDVIAYTCILAAAIMISTAIHPLVKKISSRLLAVSSH